MSVNREPSSDGSLDFNWPNDAALEGHQYDRVVFENVADQYVKGEDVTAFFTIFQDIKVNSDEDQIGLLRVRNFIHTFLAFLYSLYSIGGY